MGKKKRSPKTLSPDLVFGYGSLRTDIDGVVHQGMVPVGFGHAPGELHMARTPGGVWAGVLENKPGQVYGQVWRVPTMRLWDTLDAREGTFADPPIYYRKIVPVRLTDGEIRQAWIYFVNPKAVRLGIAIPGGDWRLVNPYARYPLEIVWAYMGKRVPV